MPTLTKSKWTYNMTRSINCQVYHCLSGMHTKYLSMGETSSVHVRECTCSVFPTSTTECEPEDEKKESKQWDRVLHFLEATDFDWVITVPAIWKARGKQMMREAGYKVN